MTSPARSPTTMLYLMVLSTGLGYFPMGWLELGRRIGWGEGAASGTNWFVADSKGGFWTSRDEKSVAKVVGMTATAGGRTRVCEEAANVDEVVLVYPGLQINSKEEGGILWEVVVHGQVGDECGGGWAVVDIG